MGVLLLVFFLFCLWRAAVLHARGEANGEISGCGDGRGPGWVCACSCGGISLSKNMLECGKCTGTCGAWGAF